MRDPLKKRILRELGSDMGKYIALFLFLTLMTGFVSGFLIADHSLRKSYDESFEEYEVEDGHFVLEKPADRELITELESEGAAVSEIDYKDESFDVQDNRSISGDDVRVFITRKEMNRQAVWEGKLPETGAEIALDRLYAVNNGVETGDEVSIGGTRFKVSGTVALSDYTAMFKTNAQFMFDANNFSVAVTTGEGFDRIRKRGLKYCYAFRYDDQSLTEDEQRTKADKFKDIVVNNIYGTNDENEITAMIVGLLRIPSQNEITDFIGRTENQAINFSGEDLGKDKVMIVTLLYLVIAMLAFIFGITVKSMIEKEAQAVGTLRASGYTRSELLRHYMILPIIVTLIGAAVGNILGYAVLHRVISGLYLHSYSLMPYRVAWSSEAFRLTTLIPVVIVIIVTVAVIYKELRIPPLQFLRGELRKTKKGGVIALKKGSFMHRFRLRVLMQNLPSYLVMIFGVFFGVFIMMFCLGMSPLLDHFRGEVKNSQMARYQYVLKEPKTTEYEAAEKYQMKGLTIDNDMNEEVSVYGIKKGSRYLKGIDVPVGDNEVLISSAYHEKYGVEEGDTLELEDEFEKKTYSLKVKGIYDYTASLALFTELENFNRTFDYREGEYIGYFSDRMIDDISEDDVATIVTEKDLTIIADQMNDSMGSFFRMFIIFGIAVFLIVIYLLSKIIIEKNQASISMVKILGYNDREISSLYSTTTMIVVYATVILSLPVSYYLFRVLFALMMLDYPGWLAVYLAPHVNLEIIVIGILGYTAMHLLQLRRIRKVPMSAALKGME